MTNDWYYQGEVYTADNIDEYYGFVYVITDLEIGKKYIGKKFFWNKRKLPPLKGRKNKRIKTVESNWRKYYGSSDTVKELVESHGPERFNREILVLCKTKGECSYFEAKLQFDNDVLLRDDYYNEFIGVKIHSTHVKTLRPDYESDGNKNA